MPSPTPVAPEALTKSFILFYRHGMNPHCQKGFAFNGTLREATERAKKHCEVMGYRFVFCRPQTVDLNEEERQHLGTDREPVKQ